MWKSDGTEAGTTELADFSAAFPNSPIYDLTAVNDTLFFEANDVTHGPELWKSDGTVAGTVIVKDINPGAADSRGFYLTNLNGTLFFEATGVNRLR